MERGKKVIPQGEYAFWNMQGTITHLHGDRGYLAPRGFKQVWVEWDQLIPAWPGTFTDGCSIEPTRECWMNVTDLVPVS